MTARHSIRHATTICGLLLAALLVLTLPIQAAPAPEETALSSPVFPEIISSGDYHACALRSDGTLARWGRDVDGH